MIIKNSFSGINHLQSFIFIRIFHLLRNYFGHPILHFENFPATVLPDFSLTAVWKRQNHGEEGLHCRWGPSGAPTLHPAT